MACRFLLTPAAVERALHTKDDGDRQLTLLDMSLHTVTDSSCVPLAVFAELRSPLPQEQDVVMLSNFIKAVAVEQGFYAFDE